MDTQKLCKGCRYYDAFYTRGICAFEKQKAGYCSRREKATSATDICSFYKYRPSQEKTVTIEHLDIVLEAVAELERLYYNYDS